MTEGSKIVHGFVHGRPRMQGSVSPIAYRKKNGRMGVNVFQKPELLNWRDLIAADVKEKTEGEQYFPKGTPVFVHLHFYFVKPKSFKGTHPVTRSSGDIDKCARAVLDALSQSGVYDDDSQVVYLISEKMYVNSEEEQGLEYFVGEYSPTFKQTVSTERLRSYLCQD